MLGYTSHGVFQNEDDLEDYLQQVSKSQYVNRVEFKGDME